MRSKLGFFLMEQKMARSFRIYYGAEQGLKGRCKMNFNWPTINFASAVNVTAAEGTAFGSTRHILGASSGQGIIQDYDFWQGDANIWVSNISPHNGGVEFILHVDWREPLSVVVTITVEDPIEGNQHYGH
jgi:hypothetical protein